jgi:hypothetical protein
MGMDLSNGDRDLVEGIMLSRDIEFEEWWKQFVKEKCPTTWHTTAEQFCAKSAWDAAIEIGLKDKQP